MFLTICIPTYNRGYILERALNSLLMQTDKDFEVIIVDDGSTDNSETIINKYIQQKDNWHYIKKEKNGGKHTALNRGISCAVGEYFLILDSDDQLTNDCVEKFKAIIYSSQYIDSDVSLCGAIGKCRNIKGETIGAYFENDKISYLDMHFFNHGKRYGDCCECIKTSILKQYSWPEDPNTCFIPESYVFDKIGLDYKLVTDNSIFRISEYLNDGITNNIVSFQTKNVVGYLYGYVSTINYIFKKCRIPLLKKLSIWRLYWNAVDFDCRNIGPRVQDVSFIGSFVKLFLPIINVIYNYTRSND